PGDVVPGEPVLYLNESTTHFDAIDAEGNVVACTQSLGGGFGSGVVLGRTGLALNNFAYWFDLDPASPNCIGPARRSRCAWRRAWCCAMAARRSPSARPAATASSRPRRRC
ncbi:MAG: hypothetical protein C4289_02815, partial [Chloroflexota bacterium]